MVTKVKTAEPRRRGLYKASGVVALILGMLFLASIVNIWLSPMPDNWLITLFKLNAGVDGVNFNMLRGPNPTDITIMAGTAGVQIGLYAALKRTSKIWSFIAAVQPLLGMLLFIVTGETGRSAVMGSTLVISFVMLRSNILSQGIAFLGILASVLLLVGDFGTTANSHSIIIAILIGIGYTLLITWLFLVG